MNPTISHTFSVAWKDKEYRWSLRKAEHVLRKAALLGAMILVVLGSKITGAEAAGPPYPYGDCSTATIWFALADCEKDTGSGKVGAAALSATFGAAAAQAEMGLSREIYNSGYYSVSCDINYVAKYTKHPWWWPFVTLHANLFVDGVKYTDNFLGADGAWEFETVSISTLWSAPRNRSYTITRRLYLGRGQHTVFCGLEDRVSTGWWDQYARMIAVGDVTRIY